MNCAAILSITLTVLSGSENWTKWLLCGCVHLSAAAEKNSGLLDLILPMLRLWRWSQSEFTPLDIWHATPSEQADDVSLRNPLCYIFGRCENKCEHFGHFCWKRTAEVKAAWILLGRALDWLMPQMAEKLVQSDQRNSERRTLSLCGVLWQLWDQGPWQWQGKSDWTAAEDCTSFKKSSLSSNTRTPRPLLFHYLLFCIVMLWEFNVVPFIVENEKCLFPLSLSSSSPFLTLI